MRILYLGSELEVSNKLVADQMLKHGAKKIEAEAKPVDPEKAAIRARAKELGIPSYHNMGIEKLKEKIVEAEANNQ